MTIKRANLLIVAIVSTLTMMISVQRAKAQLITFRYEGVVDVVDDFSGLLEGKVHVGDIITGQYTFESTEPNVGYPDFAHYLYSNVPAEFQMTASIGTLSWIAVEMDPVNFSSAIYVINNDFGFPPRDAYSVMTREAVGPGQYNSVILELITFANLNVVSDVDLPLTPPDIALFESTNWFTVAGWDDYPQLNDYLIRGHLTSLTPSSVNHPPLLAPIGSPWVYEGNLLSFTLTATDPDGDLLEYHASGLPSGANLDPGTGEFSWTPNSSQAGQYEVTFTAGDGSLEDSKVAVIIVYDGQGPAIVKKAVLQKETTLIGEKRVVESTKEELASTFYVKASFENISPEDATVTVTTFAECPNSPDGFRVGDMCFDITTDADSYGLVEICLGYDESTINSENALKLLHYEANRWVDITVRQYTEANIICGASSTLSPYMIISGTGAIVAPIDPQPVYTQVDVSSGFIDPNSLGTYRVEIEWGDGFVSEDMVYDLDGSGTARGSYEYSTPGVYTIALRVYSGQATLLGESVYRYVVVFDPYDGFVTGGGWIESPQGAYPANPTLTGKATFGFVSKYRRGGAVPTGNTEFQFTVADLNFHSDAYDWLVVAGARAQFKGTGTINGTGEFSFLLTAVDGQQSGGGGTDRFRIKIWDRITGTIIYDNQFEASDDSDPTTGLGGGSVVIHKG